jgi:hypothetical protein
LLTHREQLDLAKEGIQILMKPRQQEIILLQSLSPYDIVNGLSEKLFLTV